jgi:hypothetical protein
VAWRRRLAQLLIYVMLEAGALAGVPMRPEEIEDLTRLMTGTKVVKVVRGEEDGDGDPPLDEPDERRPGARASRSR